MAETDPSAVGGGTATGGAAGQAAKEEEMMLEMTMMVFLEMDPTMQDQKKDAFDSKEDL